MVHERPPAVYTPDNEPYLGRDSLMRFDQTIIGALKANQAVASASRVATDLSSLQRAACEIIPQAISISLSIRELIRQAYLLSGFILVRPLIERTAIISYLVRKPDAVELWKQGWPHGKRPSLARMLDSMGWAQVGESMGRKICDLYNHLVHGDPMASQWNTIDLPGGGIGYASGRITDRPELCDIIASNTYAHMLVLMAMMTATFPSVGETVAAISETIELVVGPSSSGAVH
ncbi:MAG: hypothetical protein E8D40_09475 [Nitrospira sp.]|nr:MAG: hypothetical protein E8D40_09475 [Nitrospira sp.]